MPRRSATDKKLLDQLQQAMTSYKKGYRSNPLLDQVRPHFHEKQRWFLSMDHREVMYGGAAGGGKCLTSDHDVLVFGRGWVPIADIRVGDLVASADHNGIGSWERVAQTFSYQYTGPLRISSEGATFRATPNHKWRARWESGQDSRVGTSRSSVWRWRDATELCSGLKLMAVGDKYDLSKPYFKTSEEAELFGWWLSEGSGFINGRTRLSQVKLGGREQIARLCKTLKLDTKEYDREFRPKWIPPESGTDCYNKYIPKNILFSSSAEHILKGLLGGDGYLRRKGWEYNSSSKQLAEDVQTLATILGLRATLREKKVDSDKPHWLVAAYPRTTWSISPRALDWEDYDGKVYCLEIPTTGQFLVRHNGHIHVTGNSDALLASALQYIDVPNYAALILRRTYADLSKSGALLDRASQLLAGTAMKKHDGGKKWTFPGGGKLEFGFMDNDNDKYKYQSSEYQFCVHVDTPVLRPDGTYTPIIELCVGDFVQTLQGPRRVSRVYRPKLNACVRVSSSRGEQVQSVQHRLLTARGSWASYLSMCDEAHLSEISSPSPSHTFDTPSLRTGTRCRTAWQNLSPRLNYQPPPYEPVRLPQDHPSCSASSVSEAANQTVSAVYCDGRSTEPQLQSLYDLSTLSSRQQRLTAYLGFLDDDAWCDRPNPLSEGFRCRCSTCSHPCGEQARQQSKTAQGKARQSVGVGAPFCICHNLGDSERTPECSLERLETYTHPYTKDIQNSFSVVRLLPCEITPIGFDWTMDITVEDASHYITASGLIQANCGWDELTQIPEEFYTYLFSRLRKPAKHCPECFQSLMDVGTKKPKPSCKLCYGTGFNPLHLVPIRCRSGTNPGGVHGEWVKRNFIPKGYLLADEEQQFSHVWSKQGVCILCHGKQKIEIRSVLVDCPCCDGSGYSHRYFVPARLEDNESVDAVSYEVNLAHLDPNERAGLRHGRWDFMSDGNLFQRAWFRQYGWRGEHIELYNPEGKRLLEQGTFVTFLTADTASKIKTTNDYTVICAWALCVKTAALCLLEVFRKRILVPEILPEILRLREKWNASFAIIEEASSGITIIQEAQHTARGKGLTVLAYSPHTGDKVARSHEAQIRMQNGQIYFPDTRDETIAECLNELLLFFSPDAHDDFVDNVSMASWYASGQWRTRSAGNPGQPIRRGCRPPITRFRGY